jgi:hypothetical protein
MGSEITTGDLLAVKDIVFRFCEIDHLHKALEKIFGTDRALYMAYSDLGYWPVSHHHPTKIATDPRSLYTYDWIRNLSERAFHYSLCPVGFQKSGLSRWFFYRSF